LNASDIALAQSPDIGKLVEFLSSKDSAIRYWGTVGLLKADASKLDAGAKSTLHALLNDPSDDVAAMASWVLIQAGDVSDAQKCLIGILDRHTSSALLVLNILDWLHADISPYVPAIKALEKKQGPDAGYEQSMIVYLFESHGIPVSDASRKQSQKQKKKDLKLDK